MNILGNSFKSHKVLVSSQLMLTPRNVLTFPPPRWVNTQNTRFRCVHIYIYMFKIVPGVEDTDVQKKTDAAIKHKQKRCRTTVLQIVSYLVTENNPYSGTVIIFIWFVSHLWPMGLSVLGYQSLLQQRFHPACGR